MSACAPGQFARHFGQQFLRAASEFPLIHETETPGRASDTGSRNREVVANQFPDAHRDARRQRIARRRDFTTLAVNSRVPSSGSRMRPAVCPPYSFQRRFPRKWHGTNRSRCQGTPDSAVMPQPFVMLENEPRERSPSLLSSARNFGSDVGEAPVAKLPGPRSKISFDTRTGPSSRGRALPSEIHLVENVLVET